MGGLVKKPNIAKPNLTRATEAGKEGRGETKTLRTGTRYKAQSERRVGKRHHSPLGKPHGVKQGGRSGKGLGLTP